MHPIRSLAIATCAALTSTQALTSPAPAVTQAVAEPAGGGAYRVHWSGATGAPVDVFVAARPNAPRSALRQLVDDDSDGEALVTPDTKGRPYFFVAANAGTGVWTGERVLPLEGGRNFRDLGGYATGEGKRVKWGKLYRSGTMASLTHGDYEYLGNLGIRMVCDLRTTSERTAEPNKWQEVAKVAYWSRDYEISFGELRKVLAGGAPTGEAARASMLEAYRRLPFEQAPSYRELFKRLAAKEIPLAFNCSAGKDRAGTAAALILSVLGVPRETVVEDYALSDKIVDYRRAYSQEQSGRSMLSSLPPEVVTAILGSDPDYIRTALATIDAKHGSVEAYVRNELGITAAEIESMRRELLE